jgi:hypothetical protein
MRYLGWCYDSDSRMWSLRLLSDTSDYYFKKMTMMRMAMRGMQEQSGNSVAENNGEGDRTTMITGAVSAAQVQDNARVCLSAFLPQRSV